jgi:hypothetical protein
MEELGANKGIGFGGGCCMQEFGRWWAVLAHDDDAAEKMNAPKL